MIKITTFMSDDGHSFDTEAACIHYEETLKFKDLIAKHTSIKACNIDSAAALLRDHGAGLRKVLEESTKDWISNFGNDHATYPRGVSCSTQIEVKLRDGSTHKGMPNDWVLSWRETDKDQCDIVAYRILK